MEKQPKCDGVVDISKELFFGSDERIHIQLTVESSDYIGTIHKHEFMEFSYVVSGRAKHQVDGKVYDVNEGDLFIVNPGAEHVFYDLQKGQEPFCMYDLMFAPEFFKIDVGGEASANDKGKLQILHSLFKEHNQNSLYFNVSGTNRHMLEELFRKIHTTYLRRREGYINKIQEHLVRMFDVLFRIEVVGEKESGTLYKNKAIEFVEEYIQKNFKRKISICNLAEKVYLNPDYLGRAFRKATGMTISHAIQKKRVEEACRLLRETDEVVSEVAFNSGFDDVSFFYNIFKKLKGISPNAYRKQMQQKDKT